MHSWRQFSLDIGTDISSGPWIAGGAARRLFQNEDKDSDFSTGDIDIFLPLNGYAKARKTVESEMSKLFPKDVFASLSNVGTHTVTETYMIGNRKTRVQIIGTGYENLSSLFRSFDFTVSQFAVGGQFLAFTEAARDDLGKMKLDLALPIQKRKGTTPVRINKYCRYGFTPAPGVLRWAIGLDSNKVGADMRVVDEDCSRAY